MTHEDEELDEELSVDLEERRREWEREGGVEASKFFRFFRSLRATHWHRCISCEVAGRTSRTTKDAPPQY